MLTICCCCCCKLLLGDDEQNSLTTPPLLLINLCCFFNSDTNYSLLSIFIFVMYELVVLASTDAVVYTKENMQKFKNKAANSLKIFNARISDSSTSSSSISSILQTEKERKRAITIHELLKPTAFATTITVTPRKSTNETTPTAKSDKSASDANSRVSKFDIAGIELKDYDKVKLVGQGSFGLAVLYKRRSDNIYVVFKQINLGDLTAMERDLAMNEVEVFSKLHHPNIISYFGSFIKGHTLLIEMEYADGGTLAQIVAERKIHDYFSERYILAIFEQITSAINYMHQQNILHRDLKTANMFLNKRGIVKVGDFGISKIMNTKLQTQTVLGTPYYFSPEMCEGKDYNHKSDIWALGCILGEMCCLRKAFAASNLSELVSKIMMGAYTNLPKGYSSAIKSLLDNLLQVDPQQRPDASEILRYWIPLIHSNLGKNKGHSYEETITRNTVQALITSTRRVSQSFDDTHGFNLSTKTTNVDLSTAQTRTRQIMNTSSTKLSNELIAKRSVLYQLQSFGNSFTMNPIQLPPKAIIETVATSDTHFIAVNNDGSVYVWGEGSRGQLGTANLEVWKHYPSRMESLQNQHIIQAGAGDGFTILLTSSGKLFSCGDNINGALGLPEIKVYPHPKIIEELEDELIEDIQVGTSHVMALSRNGAVFTWGSSTCGALGLGALQCKQMLPKRVISSASSKNQIKKIFCGPDVSAVLWEKGDISVCGSNQFNKLGFNKTRKIWNLKKLSFPHFKSSRIINIKFSTTHTVVLVADGYVFTMGCNTSGQRGLGHCNAVKQITLVDSISSRYILNCKCSDHYTIVCSDDNVITLWGKRYGIRDMKPTSDTSEAASFEPGNMETMMQNTKIFTSNLTSIYKSELLLQPQDLLALYSSSEQMARGYYVKVKDIYPLAYSVLVLVETSAPLTASLQDIL